MAVAVQYDMDAGLNSALFQLLHAEFYSIAIPVRQQKPLIAAFPDSLPGCKRTGVAIAGHGNDFDAESMGNQIRVIIAVSQVDEGVKRSG